MRGHVTADCPDQIGAVDVVSDQTADGRPLKILTVTDEHTREALHDSGRAPDRRRRDRARARADQRSNAVVRPR